MRQARERCGKCAGAVIIDKEDNDKVCLQCGWRPPLAPEVEKELREERKETKGKEFRGNYQPNHGSRFAYRELGCRCPKCVTEERKRLDRKNQNERMTRASLLPRST